HRARRARRLRGRDRGRRSLRVPARRRPARRGRARGDRRLRSVGQARRRPPRSARVKTDILLIPMSARWKDMRAAAAAAEEAGFDGVWPWDHLRDPADPSGPGVPEALTVLAALAEATRRISLGPLVLNVANRHPGMLANMAATLQTVSNGRVLLGIGAGGSRRTPYAREQDPIGQRVGGDPVRA